MHKLAALLFVAVFSLLFLACGGNVNVGEASCTVDSDCVPTTCCHAKACGAPVKDMACNVACTDDCEGGTIDCGGGCFCDAGTCAAHVMP